VARVILCDGDSIRIIDYHSEGAPVNRSRGFVLATAAVAALMSSPPRAQDAARLRAYNVDPAQVSVSGHASGADMAMQLGIAYSSRIMGVGVFAYASAYDCGRLGNPFYFECFLLDSPSVAGLESTMRAWSGTAIDPVSFLARQRVYAFVGKYTTVKVNQFPKVVMLYERFLPSPSLRLEDGIDVNNSFPTDFDHPYSSLNNWECSSTTPLPLLPTSGRMNAPLANCGFDGAGETLRWIYGPLKARVQAADPSSILSFDQSELARRRDGMDSLGYLYVPKSCEAGASCKLHVFLHACGQSEFTRQDGLFPRYSGHARWAETNDIVVLFPQTYPDIDANPDGCWDTNNRYSVQFNQRGGPQVEAIMAMVARITSGFAGTAKAIEYFHAGFNHYFVTSETDEIAALDGGRFAGWARTGETVDVHAPATPGTTDVCRFFSGEHYAPASSHFYTTDAAECAFHMTSAIWQFEGKRFAIKAPDAAGGCAAAEKPLFRLYNQSQGGVPNHRYTTSAATRASMIAAGWISEGAGDLGVIGCAPQ
jgi:Repeat of unknown function (DUF5648)